MERLTATACDMAFRNYGMAVQAPGLDEGIAKKLRSPERWFIVPITVLMLV